MKVEIEYDAAYRRWYVWKKGWFSGKLLLGSGETREIALSQARTIVAKGGHKKEITEL